MRSSWGSPIATLYTFDLNKISVGLEIAGLGVFYTPATSQLVKSRSRLLEKMIFVFCPSWQRIRLKPDSGRKDRPEELPALEPGYGVFWGCNGVDSGFY